MRTAEQELCGPRDRVVIYVISHCYLEGTEEDLKNLRAVGVLAEVQAQYLQNTATTVRAQVARPVSPTQDQQLPQLSTVRQ